MYKPSKDWSISVSETEKLIDEWIFNKEYRQFMKDRMLDCVPFTDLALKYHWSEEWTRDLYYQLRREIFSHKDD